MALFSVFVEVAVQLNFGAAVFKYSQIVPKVDPTIQIGSFVILISSIAKIVSALTARQYALDRTDRTPEKRVNTAKFFRLVTFVTFVVAVSTIHLLNLHHKSSLYDQNSLLNTTPEMLIKAVNSITSVQMTVFFSGILHMILHFFTHRLDVIERTVPRVVDLHAAKSLPKKNQ